MADRTIVVVSAGIGTPSSTRLLADRLGSAVELRLRSVGLAPATTTLELRDLAHELTDNLLTGFPVPALRGAIDAVVAADGLIAVSPIFSASYNGLFKMFFDVLDRDGLAEKPVLIAATGGSPRHSLALEHAFRPLFAYLDAAVVPTAVYAATEDWGGADDPIVGALVDRIERAAAEMARAVAAEERSVPLDPFADPTPFEDLLTGSPSTSSASRETR
ncbi:MAG TPA: FMN reductase [Candidatus Limnocylindrales bacterium]|nr:FMN reductase [Candidatus Limnocylindrales bacterium]